ncbi:MgtC/SapB family protein [Streptomyces sp. NPDC001586]|uniref:MgtC/SapB family protein n=1 Tax=Streptomyces sp. NPDC001586 TaxID=3154387 RepID=UPI003331A93A
MTSEWIMAGHMAAALGFGAAIGVERQWRARMAGLRTNALVAGGAALFVLAAFGTVGVVGANLLLRPLGRRLDREPRGGAEVATDYHFEAVCLETEEAHIRHRLADALARPGYRLREIRSADGPDPGKVTVSALLTAEGEGARALEEAVSTLSLDPSVSAVGWSVVPA